MAKIIAYKIQVEVEKKVQRLRLVSTGALISLPIRQNVVGPVTRQVVSIHTAILGIVQHIHTDK